MRNRLMKYDGEADHRANTTIRPRGDNYLKKIGRELNVRYVLEGSMQRSGTRLRVNVQLIDAETGNHLWAERFDKPVADLFDMQDEIVSRLANTLNAQFVEAEARRAEGSLRPDAMDLYFQGRASFNKGQTLENLTQARGFFERAMARADTVAPEMTSSMHHDLERGNRLEAPWLCGAVVDIGTRHGVPTPCNRAIRDILSVRANGCLKR
jgi:ketopantoate reductase PanE/ApbA-like protein